MGKAKHGILHNHTEFSVRDSAMSINQLFERAKALEAPAVALTDHGILTGIIDFMKAGEQYGIKPIPGIEAYFTPDGEALSKNEKSSAQVPAKAQHLILMAKDLRGYHAICKAVYLSYRYILKDNPCMDLDILRRVFGPGSEGHDHVIATSACVGGPLASILLEDEMLKQSTEKLIRQRDKYHPVDSEVVDAVFKEEQLTSEIDSLIKKREALTEAAKVNLNGLKRKLKAMKPEDADYAEAEQELADATKAKEDAASALADIKREIAEKKRAKSAYSKSIAAMKTSAEKWVSIDDKINAVLASGSGDEVLYRKATEACKELHGIFGEGNFYIELQYHHITNEKKVMPLLAKMAGELNIPVVAANDAHYATRTYDDVRARSLVAAMRFNKEVEEDVEGYGELYMRDDDELLAALSEVIDPAIAKQAIENIGAIVDACDVKMTHGTHYPVFPTTDGETAEMRLRRLATEGIPKRYPGKAWTPEYAERMEYELGVIQSMGYSDYLCIVQDFLEYGRKLGYECPEKIGYTIGPGRGSGVGSIVCYLTGITSVDPMRYGLLFERFLNPERVSMPDIDSDLAPEVRERVIDYVREKYRSTDPKIREDGTPICSIITKGTMAARAAIRNVARVTNMPDSIADELANLVPKEPHAKIDDIPDLEKRCAENNVVRKLIADAKLVEGATINYGVHAAGVIIADNGDVGEYAPLYRNITKNQATGPWVAQLDMGQCENDAGLLKMDFLGLINLDVITDTLRRIYRNYGTRIDIEKLPEEPEVFRDIFAAGNTDSIFQFESDGMKRMLREFRPTSMEDLILLVAAYRPGPMDDIPKIIASKFGKEVPKYIADGLKEILAPTYGYPIYQEQVMQIFNRVADFSLGESDIIRRAMSKKKLSVLTDPKTNYKGKFIEGLQRHGATEQDANEFWERLLAFASYAFNKSHAAAYATISYMTAWLKYHYTAEYMCSVMMRTGFDKLPKLVNVCRKSGLRIAPPDINRSQEGFINEENSILFGFGDIKGVGNAGAYIVAEREARGAFRSVKDFVMRMLSNENSAGYDRSVMEVLIKAGAFDAFCDSNRSSLLSSIDEFTAAAKKLVEKRNQFATRSANLEKLRTDGASADAIKKAERSLASCEKALAVASEVCSQHNFIITHEDVSKRLEAEYELLGMYVSGNPFSVYSDAAAKVRDRSDIADACQFVNGWTAKVCGVIKDLRILQRKKDGMPFAAFTLFDESGEIDVKCFVKAYEKYSELVDEGAAITVTGKIRLDSYTADDGSVIEKGTYITAEEITPLRRNSNERIIFAGASILDYTENEAEIRKYESANGCAAFFIDAVDSQLRALGFPVSKDILSADLHGLSVSISRV